LSIMLCGNQTFMSHHVTRYLVDATSTPREI
jgi:hypothetical protein